MKRKLLTLVVALALINTVLAGGATATQASPAVSTGDEVEEISDAPMDDATAPPGWNDSDSMSGPVGAIFVEPADDATAPPGWNDSASISAPLGAIFVQPMDDATAPGGGDGGGGTCSTFSTMADDDC